MLRRRLFRCTLLIPAICAMGPVSAAVAAAPKDDHPEYLDQGWNSKDRKTWYWTPEGSELLPTKWLLVLIDGKAEELKKTGVLMDPDGPDDLPIGLASQPSAMGDSEYLPRGTPMSGFTCSLCHTGEIHYANKKIRIMGAPSMHNAQELLTTVSKPLVAACAFPWKFKPFAKAVLGADYEKDKRKLRDEVCRVVKKAVWAQLTERKYYPTMPGNGRLEGFGQGANIAFGAFDTRNLEVADAPVSYPHLWQTGNFDWTQWNGAIHQPLARNVAQALGVYARVELKGNEKWETSIKESDLTTLDALVEKLKPPPWPEAILGKIDTDLAADGKSLFQENCQPCHEPQNGRKDDIWKLNLLPIHYVGTDPGAARNFDRRTVYTTDELWGEIPIIEAIKNVTCEIIKKWRKSGSCSDRGRPNRWQRRWVYKARTLDGIWATGPFLHNGSVPSVYKMLSPVEERPEKFRVGSREFDPVFLGFDTQKGGFEFDTRKKGNSNAGHQFREGPRGNGTIGPALSHDQRMELIEYLKILGGSTPTTR